jgi:hypothetical protein
MRNLFNFGVNRVMLETLISILFMLRQILVSDLEHLASLKKKKFTFQPTSYFVKKFSKYEQ